MKRFLSCFFLFILFFSLYAQQKNDSPQARLQEFNQLLRVAKDMGKDTSEAEKMQERNFFMRIEGLFKSPETAMEGEDEVIDFETIINSVAFLRNQYLGLIKGLEQKSFALGHITRLRTAGMELTEIG